MKSLFNRFVNNESGATAIEYGLIAALVAVALIAGAKMVGTELDSTFVAVGTELQTARQ
jgi:pilus assembly protein Flp/PilA